MVHDPSNDSRQPSADPYRYRNTRPVSVFMLALIAAIVALAMVWFGWSAIGTSTEEHRLPPPPDLKKTVQRIEARGKDAVKRIDREVDDVVVAATDSAPEPQASPSPAR